MGSHWPINVCLLFMYNIVNKHKKETVSSRLTCRFVRKNFEVVEGAHRDGDGDEDKDPSNN
jgi:hypothetical protein